MIKPSPKTPVKIKEAVFSSAHCCSAVLVDLLLVSCRRWGIFTRSGQPRPARPCVMVALHSTQTRLRKNQLSTECEPSIIVVYWSLSVQLLTCGCALGV